MAKDFSKKATKIAKEAAWAGIAAGAVAAASVVIEKTIAEIRNTDDNDDYNDNEAYD